MQCLCRSSSLCFPADDKDVVCLSHPSNFFFFFSIVLFPYSQSPSLLLSTFLITFPSLSHPLPLYPNIGICLSLCLPLSLAVSLAVSLFALPAFPSPPLPSPLYLPSLLLQLGRCQYPDPEHRCVLRPGGCGHLDGEVGSVPGRDRGGP